MSRILAHLGFVSLLLVAVALVIGLWVPDLYGGNPAEKTLRLATAHRLTGTAAALGVVFVESLIVTYFIGTSRWCREVVEVYQLDKGLADESQRLKRRAFPPALAGMLAVVGISALGAASDPATGRAGTENWTTFHLISALCGFVLIGWTYYLAWQYVVSNQRTIDLIAEAVATERQRRGLAGVEPAAKAG
jgi:hypothetical protein